MTSAVFISRGLVAFSSPIPNDAFRTTGGRSTLGADTRYGGSHRIFGTVKNTGTPNVPAYRQVRLHEQLTGYVVREMWSNPVTGAFEFKGIKAGVYYITTFDYTLQYNGEVATDLIAEPMLGVTP